jgi:hypothetical protein
MIIFRSQILLWRSAGDQPSLVSGVFSQLIHQFFKFLLKQLFFKGLNIILESDPASALNSDVATLVEAGAVPLF